MTDENPDFAIDYKALFMSEIMKYTPENMEYAIKNNLDITQGVLKRLDAYNENFKVVKIMIRTFWGRLAYLFDNPDVLSDYVFENKPELNITGAREYINEQVKKCGYALVDWLSPSTKVKVKLDVKALKYANKMEKKKSTDNTN